MRVEPKKEKVATKLDAESRSSDMMTSKNDGESPLFLNSLKGSVTGSSILHSSHSSLIGSRNHLSEQSSRKPINMRTIPILMRTIPILSELREQKEQKELQTIMSTVETKASSQKAAFKKVQKPVDESDPVSKIFKTYDAFADFQTKYSKPIEESAIIKADYDIKNQHLENRKEQIKRLHYVATKNRERISLYMSGESNYGMGVPIGFKVDPHAITDKILPQSQKAEEMNEQISITEEINTSVNRSISEKRASFSSGKGNTGYKPDNETDDNTSNKKAFNLAQSQLEKGRRPTFHLNRELSAPCGNYTMDNVLQNLSKNIDKDEKLKHSRQNNLHISLEEEDLLKSLAVVDDDRGLSSDFLQRSLSRTDSLIRRPSELNKTFSRQKTLILPEKEETHVSLLEEDSDILQFSSHSDTSNSSSIQNLAAANVPKVWEHINMKSVEDFGSVLETSKAKLDEALKCIPNSFNQLCLNIKKDDSRPKLGVFAESISSQNNFKMIQSNNTKFKIPKAVKYWKTSSSFDDDIPIFS
jgi:hypothetical protein